MFDGYEKKTVFNFTFLLLKKISEMLPSQNVLLNLPQRDNKTPSEI